MSLKAKLMIVICATLAVLFIALSLFITSKIETIIEQKENEQSILISKAIDTRLSEQINALKTAVTAIAMNKESQRLFAERDREGLSNMYLSYYQQIKGQISQFQFHLPNSDSFLRLHKPEKYGDNLSSIRFTVNDCNALKKPITGIEEGVFGYGFRVIYPVSYMGNHIGSVEFGSDLGNSYLTSLKNNFGGEYF